VQLDRLIAEANDSNLASIKNTISEIIGIINDPDSSARRLTQLIELDPPLSARILRVANSPYYASPHHVDDIRYAIIRIGYNEVKTLALSQKVLEFFSEEIDLPGFTLHDLWKHSVSTALLCKNIYRSEFRESGENIYAAGLLHDIGIIVECQFMPEIFSEILLRRAEHPGNLLGCENEILGYNHETIALELLRQWEFPIDLIESIGHHHQPSHATKDHARMAGVLYIADALCQQNHLGYCDTAHVNRFYYEKHLSQLNLSGRAVDLLMDQTKHEIARMEHEGWF